MRKFASYFCVLIMSVSICCETELPPFRWEGRNVRFATTQENLPCLNTLESLDDTIGFLSGAMMKNSEAPTTIEYFWMPTEGQISECSIGGECTLHNRVFSKIPIHTHEIVHALLSNHPLSHRLLSEGVAEHWGNYFFSESTHMVEYRRYVEEYIEGERDKIVYNHSGLFVRHLVDRYGWDKVYSLLKYSNRDWSKADFSFFFEREFNNSLENILNEFESEVDWCYEVPLLNIENSLEWTAEHLWTYKFKFRCEENEKDFLSEYTLETWAYQNNDSWRERVAFDIVISGYYRFCVTNNKITDCLNITPNTEDIRFHRSNMVRDFYDIRLERLTSFQGPGCAKVNSFVRKLDIGIYEKTELEEGKYLIDIEAFNELNFIGKNIAISIERISEE